MDEVFSSRKWRFWLGVFVVVLGIRQWLEFFESVPRTRVLFVDVSTFVHASIFYTFFFLVIGLIVARFTGWTLERAARTLLKVSPLLLVAPLIDLLFFGRYGIAMSYHFVSVGEFVSHFFSFFGPLTLGGVTFGMRIQVLGILGLVGYWVYAQKKSVGETVLAALVLYAAIYCIASAPSVFGWLEWMRTGELRMSIGSAAFSAIDQSVARSFDWGAGGWITTFRFNMLMAQLWFLGLAMFGLSQVRESMKLVYTKSRALRAALYVGLMILGAALAPSYLLNVDIAITSAGIVSACLASLVAFLVWTYAFVVNDLNDVMADQIVHRDRALPQGRIDHQRMIILSFVTAIGGLLGALLLPWPSAIGILIFLVCATLYSVPPFQLRRFFAIPQLLMAIASLGILFFGYALVAKDAVAAQDIRLAAAIGFLLFGFWFFKDIADEAGDRRAGYRTIMTLYGKKGPWVGYWIFVGSSVLPMILLPRISVMTAMLALHIVVFVLLKKGRLSEALLPALLICYLAALFI